MENIEKSGDPDPAQHDQEDNVEENDKHEDSKEPTAKKLKAEPKLPLARVKKIIAQDEDLGQIRKEALILISKATELFIEYLTQQAEKNSHKGGRKQVKADGLFLFFFCCLLTYSQ